MSKIPTPLSRAAGHGRRTALVDPAGAVTYDDLVGAARRVSAGLLAGRVDLEGARVCHLVPPGRQWVAVTWGTWLAGGVAVPMAVSHPLPELERTLADARPDVLVVDPSDPPLAERGRAAARGRPEIRVRNTASLASLTPRDEPDVAHGRPALMLYTSGSTGPPKGVVLTHANLEASVRSLVEAWEWSADDRILLHLPLHHVHGIVNVLGCALWCGAVCEVMPRFDPAAVWERMARGGLTLYMAVPTVYRRLLDAWDAAEPGTRRRWSDGARRLRLMVSGSAALPVATLDRWEEITGHRLLERYGMTEIGMALSNPLRGERRPGFVGTPLPGVEVRLVDDEGGPVPLGTPGTIEVRGPAVFTGYWRRPRATAEAFTDDGWFRTGDRAVVEDGAWRILGRESVDILKTGGEKVSALEIEDVLRAHPDVADCAVVGVPDPEWGERVCAAVVPGRDRAAPDAEALRAFARERLAPWKVPKDVLLLDELPTNAMGKVTKPRVAELFAPGPPAVGEHGGGVP